MTFIRATADGKRKLTKEKRNKEMAPKTIFVLVGAVVLMAGITTISLSGRHSTNSCEKDDKQQQQQQQQHKKWELVDICRKPAMPSSQTEPVIVEMKSTPISAEQVLRMNESQLQEFCGGFHVKHTGWKEGKALEYCIHNPEPDCCVSRKIARNSFWEMDLMTRFDKWLDREDRKSVV